MASKYKGFSLLALLGPLGAGRSSGWAEAWPHKGPTPRTQAVHAKSSLHSHMAEGVPTLYRYTSNRWRATRGLDPAGHWSSASRTRLLHQL
eukprot:6864020-Lingulodinium_polyedra.AAC.1